MIVIREPAPILDPALVERFRHASTGAAGHVLEFGFADTGLHPLLPGLRIAGQALTVRTNGLDSAVVHVAIDQARPGEIIVLDVSGDQRHANWGEMTSLAAQQRGVAGAIIDGVITDVSAVRDLHFQVYCRGVSALTSRGPALSGEINTPVQCGGVLVTPGDLVVADEDGILFLPAARAEAVWHEVCEPREQREVWLRTEILRGRALADLSGAAERVAASRAASEQQRTP